MGWRRLKQQCKCLCSVRRHQLTRIGQLPKNHRWANTSISRSDNLEKGGRRGLGPGRRSSSTPSYPQERPPLPRWGVPRLATAPLRPTTSALFSARARFHPIKWPVARGKLSRLEFFGGVFGGTDFVLQISAKWRSIDEGVTGLNKGALGDSAAIPTDSPHRRRFILLQAYHICIWIISGGGPIKWDHIRIMLDIKKNYNCGMRKSSECFPLSLLLEALPRVPRGTVGDLETKEE